MKNEVIAFNRARNRFELDEKLERAMLMEEVQEFFGAVTLPEKLKEFVDCVYVWDGTVAKYSFNGKVVPKDMSEWMINSLNFMSNTLQELLGDDMKQAVLRAQKIVCDANALKGTDLTEQGKVAKSADFKDKVDDTKMIEKMLIGLSNERV